MLTKRYIGTKCLICFLGESIYTAGDKVEFTETSKLYRHVGGFLHHSFTAIALHCCRKTNIIVKKLNGDCGNDDAWE